MDKKKFKDTKVGKFLLEKIPSVVGSIAGDTAVGSVIQAIIGGSDMSKEDKELALKKLELERTEMEGITQRWVADSKSTTTSFVAGWILQLEELSVVKELLTIVFIGYFGSRGAEKIMGNNKHK